MMAPVPSQLIKPGHEGDSERAEFRSQELLNIAEPTGSLVNHQIVVNQ